MSWRNCKSCGQQINDDGDRFVPEASNCPDCAPDRKPCSCSADHRPTDCSRHGIGASNERSNNYWQRVGR